MAPSQAKHFLDLGREPWGWGYKSRSLAAPRIEEQCGGFGFGLQTQNTEWPGHGRTNSQLQSPQFAPGPPWWGGSVPFQRSKRTLGWGSNVGRWSSGIPLLAEQGSINDEIDARRPNLRFKFAGTGSTRGSRGSTFCQLASAPLVGRRKATLTSPKRLPVSSAS